MNHKWIVGKNPKFILSVKSPKQQLVEIFLTFINFIRFKSWLHTSNHNQSYFLLLCYYNIMYMITTWPHWFETILLSDYYYLYHENLIYTLSALVSFYCRSTHNTTPTDQTKCQKIFILHAYQFLNQFLCLEKEIAKIFPCKKLTPSLHRRRAAVAVIPYTIPKQYLHST